jgi:hypothetical protein
MTQRPKSRNSSLQTERHPITLFNPALNANFQGDHVAAFGTPAKIISDLKSPQKAPAIFHRRRDGAKFASTLSMCKQITSTQDTAAYIAPPQGIEPCEMVIMKTLGGFGSAKHGRIIAHAARFDMLEDDDARDTTDFPNKSMDAKRGLTSAQVAVLKEMSLRSHSNSLSNALDDKDSSIHSDAMDMWLEDITKERKKFASAHLFAKTKLRESIENADARNPTANETTILCCCFADMITSLSLTTDIKAELGQMWGRLMRCIFQSWEDSATALLVSQAHTPFLRPELFKQMLALCYQRHTYHDIADKVRSRTH